MERLARSVKVWVRHEAAGGILLMAAAVFAMFLDNSPLDWLYDSLLATPVSVQVGGLIIAKPLLLWINDGLMAVFFFLVGLEIKRELMEGRLSSINQASLPVIAAVGGMVMPALVFLAFNVGNEETIRGWAIPAATDIAFALGALALLGSRVPAALKIFLLALAIIDDLGAIIIIALFYTADLSLTSLGIAALCTLVLAAMNLFGVRRIAPYILIGLIMWICVLKSGIHATLAGVVVALFIPLKQDQTEKPAPLHRLEHSLHPWVAFFIMPVFAFANAGVALNQLSFEDLLGPLPLGIGLGLFIGKQVGVFGFTWAVVRLGLCRLPDGLTWRHIYGAALLAGVGFTMSLFIGGLAFSGAEQATQVRLGVLLGSLLSGVGGFLVLRYWARAADPTVGVAEEKA